MHGLISFALLVFGAGFLPLVSATTPHTAHHPHTALTVGATTATTQTRSAPMGRTSESSTPTALTPRIVSHQRRESRVAGVIGFEAGPVVALATLLASLLAAVLRYGMRRPAPLALASCGGCANNGGCGCNGQKAIDKNYMAMALAEGEKGRWTAPPNPWVGSVIVKDDKVLGIGYHAKAGTPHAERMAIADALAKGCTDEDLAGSTFYVTLEPCCHYGRTPPCTDALIERKAKRVVVAVTDPDERVAGQGIQKLRDAGMEVVVGVLEAEASVSLGPYLHARRNNVPLEAAPAPTTLDVVSSD